MINEALIISFQEIVNLLYISLQASRPMHSYIVYGICFLFLLAPCYNESQHILYRLFKFIFTKVYVSVYQKLYQLSYSYLTLTYT